MPDEEEAEPAPGDSTPFRGWPAVGCIVLLVLFAGIVAVQFIPVERLHGWPLYIGWAFLLIGGALEVLFLGVEVIAWLTDTTEWVLRTGRGGRGKGSG